MGCSVGKLRRRRPKRKIASWKVLFRFGAIKAVLERREPGKGTCRLLPRTVLEALHEHIAELCWESASSKLLGGSKVKTPSSVKITEIKEVQHVSEVVPKLSEDVGDQLASDEVLPDQSVIVAAEEVEEIWVATINDQALLVQEDQTGSMTYSASSYESVTQAAKMVMLDIVPAPPRARGHPRKAATPSVENQVRRSTRQHNDSRLYELPNSTRRRSSSVPRATPPANLQIAKMQRMGIEDCLIDPSELTKERLLKERKD
ncbi:hypothetical protein ACQ4PT_022108 [Festuca glaucescens]